MSSKIGGASEYPGPRTKFFCRDCNGYYSSYLGMRGDHKHYPEHVFELFLQRWGDMKPEPAARYHGYPGPVLPQHDFKGRTWTRDDPRKRKVNKAVWEWATS